MKMRLLEEQMSWVWIVQVHCDRASEGRAAGVYGAGFTAGSLARLEARGGTRGLGIKVSSGKELM
jgi:hypothetical protein